MNQNPLPLSPLTNEEFLQFFDQLLQTVSTGDEPLPRALEGARTEVVRTHGNLKALYKRDKASELTGKMVDSDGRRDGHVTGISTVCEGYTYHPDEAMRTAAQALDRCFQVYGPRIYKQTYQKETAIIKAILRDAREKPALAAAVRTLGLESWMTTLEAENKLFEDLFLQRNALNAETDLPFTMIETRDKMKEYYENLLHKLYGFYHTAEGAEPWGSLVKKVEVLTDTYRIIVAQRQGRKEAKKEKGAES